MVGVVDEDSSSINSSNSKNEVQATSILDSEPKIKDEEKIHIECETENDNASDVKEIKPQTVDVSLKKKQF